MGTSPDALPLSHSRLVGVNATKLLLILYRIQKFVMSTLSMQRTLLWLCMHPVDFTLPQEVRSILLFCKPTASHNINFKNYQFDMANLDLETCMNNQELF